jgi:hypothetical protein
VVSREELDELRRALETRRPDAFGRSVPDRFGARNVSPVRTYRTSTGRTLYLLDSQTASVGPGGTVTASAQEWSRGVDVQYGRPVAKRVRVFDRDPLEPGGFTIKPGTGSDFARGLLTVAAVAAPIAAVPFLAGAAAAGASGAGAGASAPGVAASSAGQGGGMLGLKLADTGFGLSSAAASSFGAELSSLLPSAGAGSIAPSSIGLSASSAGAVWDAALRSSLPAITGAGGGGINLSAVRDLAKTAVEVKGAYDVLTFKPAGRAAGDPVQYLAGVQPGQLTPALYHATGGSGEGAGSMLLLLIAALIIAAAVMG